MDNTAEAVAAGALYSDAAGKFAVLAKTARNATIGFVVFGDAIYWARKSNNEFVQHKGAFLWKKFPKFVLGFLLISLAATLAAFGKPQIANRGYRQPLSMGISADVCRGRLRNQYRRTTKAGPQTASGGCYW